MLLSAVANLGAGFAQTYGTLMTARVFQSIGISSGYVVGSAVVVDLFEPQERGAKTGVWTLMVTIGPSIGPLIGAFLTNSRGWRWSLWLCAIINGAELVLYVFTFRETASVEGLETGSLSWIPRAMPGRRLRLQQFWKPCLFVQSPAIVISAFAYGITFGFSLVGLTNIEPLAFGALYDFGTVQNGLVFLSVLVGAVIGEQVSGPLSDAIMKRYIKRCEQQDKVFRYEHRLIAAIPGYFLSPVGLIIYGVTLHE
jgi:MFS family permease